MSRLTAWDLKFADRASAPSRAAVQQARILAAPGVKQAVAGANLVISAVTAAQIGEAAASVAPHLPPGAYFFDLNSTSPAAKNEAAGVIEAAGGRFVEAAIMSPIAPRRAASPMLLGGAHAADFLPLARELGFTGAQVFNGKLGAASAAKMCRSVVVKGPRSTHAGIAAHRAATRRRRRGAASRCNRWPSTTGATAHAT